VGILEEGSGFFVAKIDPDLRVEFIEAPN